MANAKPSRPGSKKVASGPQGEINIPTDSVIGRLPDGTVVARTTYNSGNTKDITLFQDDYPDAKPFADEE
jgi:hypothetical protein